MFDMIVNSVRIGATTRLWALLRVNLCLVIAAAPVFVQDPAGNSNEQRFSAVQAFVSTAPATTIQSARCGQRHDLSRQQTVFSFASILSATTGASHPRGHLLDSVRRPGPKSLVAVNTKTGRSPPFTLS